MDYKTHPASRQDIRHIADWIRKLFKCKNKYLFPVVRVFEKIHFILPQITTEVVEDDELDENVPACCIPDMCGNYHIKVKNYVYEGAVSGVGGYRAHVLHEISHAILCILGFTPLLERSYKNGELKPYESMEWQAKALCGELMMPYEATEGLEVWEIQLLCKVSKASALLRCHNYNTSERSDVY